MVADKKIGSIVGSVAKVNSEKLSAKPVANAMDALQGQVSGLQVYTSSGEPGSSSSSYIRGVGSLTADNEPLYVLDGTPVSSSVMVMMNPNDFESVTVLKDASATSIYGSRAANGVIYITTKRGKIGEKAVITASGNYGTARLARRVSNVLAAVLSGVKGLHTTINGLGERAGNAPLASVQAILKDHFHAITNIDESRLNVVSRLVESYSGVTIPANKPIVGDSVFTQVAGVHADGDNKNNLYCNDLLPERFGRIREYALGKNSGKANIRKNLESLGLELDEESMKKVTDRIIELGDRKEQVTQEDLPYIISDVLKHDTAENR